MEINAVMNNTDLVLRERLSLQAQLEAKKQELRELDLYKEINELEKKVSELKIQYDEYTDAIKENMLAVWLKEFTTLDGRQLMLKKSPWKVKITDKEKIEETYSIEKVTKSIDKKTILALLRVWVKVVGAELDTTYTLQIKQK